MSTVMVSYTNSNSILTLKNAWQSVRLHGLLPLTTVDCGLILISYGSVQVSALSGLETWWSSKKVKFSTHGAACRQHSHPFTSTDCSPYSLLIVACWSQNSSASCAYHRESISRLNWQWQWWTQMGQTTYSHTVHNVDYYESQSTSPLPKVQKIVHVKDIYKKKTVIIP